MEAATELPPSTLAQSQMPQSQASSDPVVDQPSAKTASSEHLSAMAMSDDTYGAEQRRGGGADQRHHQPAEDPMRSS